MIDSDFSGRSTWEALVGVLSRTGTSGHPPRAVLVLDNCEHVLAGVADVLVDLLEAIPELTVLATSREPIGWVDECVVRVPPLPRRHALSLFRQRAELTGYPLTAADETSAAAICRRVHNYPLYIQLAAARLTHQPPAVILRGLTGQADDARLRWSRSPRSGADPRHRGVSDAITWSYELCTDKERLLFDRLSVFAAGYDTHPDDRDGTAADVGTELEAIQAICGDGDLIESGDVGVALAPDEIETVLERLVDHALVSTLRTSNTVRYALVETLRVYAQDRLRLRSRNGVEEPDRLAERHLRYYRDTICHAATHWPTSEGQHLLGWSRTAWANTAIALETSLTTPARAALGVEICVGLLTMQNYVNGSIREMRGWTQRCLDAARDGNARTTELHIAGMAAIAGLALHQGDMEGTERILEDCVASCIDDPETRAGWRNSAETDIGLPPHVERAWAQELLIAHSDPRAIDVFLRARDKFLTQHDHGQASICEMNAAFTASLLGTAEQSRAITKRYYDRVNSPGTPWERSWAELAWAVAVARHGDPGEAVELERSSLAYQLTVDDWLIGMWAVQVHTWTLARLVAELLASNHSDRARLVALATEIARLTGGTAIMAERFGLAINEIGPLSARSVEAVVVARRVLGSHAYAAAEACGRRLRPEYHETQRLALGTMSVDSPLNSRPDNHGPISRWHELTRTERTVAILAAAGWTNPAIAARRGKSTRTIDAQITAILRKLVVASREDIIEHIPRETIDDVRAEATNQPVRKKRR